MRQKILQALQGSVEKWAKIIAKTDIDKQSENCPLCNIFLNQSDNGECLRCPVKQKTGLNYCHGSPYKEWSDHQLIKHGQKFQAKIYCSTCEELAIEELNFLKSLLPKAKP